MLRCSYLIPETGIKGGQKDLGDIRVDWTLQGDNSVIKQFNVTWHCQEDGATQSQCIDVDERSTIIAVARLRCRINTIQYNNINFILQKTLAPFSYLPAKQDRVILSGSWHLCVTDDKLMTQTIYIYIYISFIRMIQ